MVEDRHLDVLEEIDNPSDLLSRPLEPAPLFRPLAAASPQSIEKKRVLPPSFHPSSTGAGSSSSSNSKIWSPANHTVPLASPSGASGGSSLIIGGSGARVPTQFLDQNGGFSRTAPTNGSYGTAGQSATAPAPSMPGTFPMSSTEEKPPSVPVPKDQLAQQNAAVVDLTLDSDDEDEEPAANALSASAHHAAHQSAGPSRITLPQGNGSAAPALQAVHVDDDGKDDDKSDDEDEPVIVSHRRAWPKAEGYVIDHVKSNAIVCAGMISAVVLCMHGLPASLTYNGTIDQEPPVDPNFSRENWPRASRFWTESGYRPIMLQLSQPTGLSASMRTLPNGWAYPSTAAQRPDIKVSVVVPPRARFPQLSVEQAARYGPAPEPAFGSLAEKYVSSMEPLLRNNKVRCEARCRMVPIGRAQNFLHHLEILVFVRRPDLGLISDRLSAFSIQLEHPLSYYPEDYPTEPQYSNPHNPSAASTRSDAVQAIYNGIHRGAGMGTIIANRELSEKEKKAQVDAVYASLRSGEELAAVEPAEGIATPLLPHQKQALGFLLNRERDRRWTELLVEPPVIVDDADEASTPVKAEGSSNTSKASPSNSSDVKDSKGKGKSKSKSESESKRKSRGKSKSKQEQMVDEDSISLWTVRKGSNGKVRAWRNLITNRETLTQPRICRGAILADDMGLGKTITTLALITHTRKDARLFGAAEVERDPDAELVQAMRSPPTSAEAESREAERRNGVRKVKSRFKRRLNDSDDDDSATSDEGGDAEKKEEEEEEEEPTASLVVHGAPPPAKPTFAKSTAKKPSKDKMDPELVRRRHLECRTRATLIVCPLSVVSNWEDQIKEHCSRQKRPRIYIYHGPTRSHSTKWIADHDIVLTTYSTLGSEFSNQSTWVTETETKKSKKDGSPDHHSGHEDDDDDDDILLVTEDGTPIKGEGGAAGAQKKGKKLKRKQAKEALNPLQRIEWFRIVLDEAHQIKGVGTWQSRAACNLTAQRRLCLTGTPIQNTINDLYALVKFLRLEPFTDRAVWNQYCGYRENLHLRVKKDDGPIDSANIGHVQILMKLLALRRQKTSKTADGKPLLSLPPKLSKTEYLDFEAKEKARYQALHDKYREDFEDMMANDTVKSNYATILHEILNLRMTCDHPSMVDASKDASRIGRGADLSVAIKEDGLTPDRAAVLFILFRDSEMAYCSECQADLSNSVEGDGAGNDAQELADALDEFTSDSRNGVGPRKRSKVEPGTGSMSATTSSNSFGSPAASGAVRPVVTRCQHIFCSACFRRTIGCPWPDVTCEDVGRCPACNTSLKLAIDAVELDASDFAGLNDDQAERMADGDSDLLNDDVADERRSKQLKDADSEVDELEDVFDWGIGDDVKPQLSRRNAPRKNGKSTASSERRLRINVPLDGRKDLSTKIRALIADLLPFSKCNPHSDLFDPLAPRLVHIDPSTSEDAEVRKVEEPVVVIQRPPPAVMSNGLLGKLDQSLEAYDSYEPVKSVVFSQWTKMLDRIQKSLNITGIRYTRLDGTMSRPDRTAALEAFKRDAGIEVLLVSLRAGGTGLNLVSACRAYLMDPYWNPAVENQGLDRIHRMGQTRPVITTKYIMRHSIEENMLRLQKRKMMIAEKVGSKRQVASADARRDERREELKILFGTSRGGVDL